MQTTTAGALLRTNSVVEAIKIVGVQVELNGRDNEVLASLLVAERRRLQPLLERVEIESGKVVIEPDEPFVTSISPSTLLLPLCRN